MEIAATVPASMMEAAVNMTASLIIALMMLGSGLAANAAEPEQQVKVGVGIFCDSAEQVDRYLTLNGQNAAPEDTLRAVNEEAKNPAACGVAAIAFVADERIRTVIGSNGAMRIMRVTVIATVTETGWLAVPATTKFTAFSEKSVEV
jgi:hypothetical protein